MILEIDELDFRRVTPAQLTAVRPKLERLADITRRNLRLLEAVLALRMRSKSNGETTILHLPTSPKRTPRSRQCNTI